MSPPQLPVVGKVAGHANGDPCIELEPWSTSAHLRTMQDHKEVVLRSLRTDVVFVKSLVVITELIKK